jgi:hypothetical protein
VGVAQSSPDSNVRETYWFVDCAASRQDGLPIALDTLDLPTAWIPSGPEDPVITALFEQHQPEESSETKPPRSVVPENE